ncbi:MAG: nickel pincer cofactor biosynthesis protein LarC [Planctomycetota bacterium]|jgi:uncharacterized protein (TIGR00299 family) protein|nr:nickel pincer cofactor biosynthesis protein LarC [Planctomycetota bacterium]
MHLHIDCTLGMSGDMFLAALIDAGADLDAVLRGLERLPLEGFSITGKKTPRNGIAALSINVEDLTEAESADRAGHGRDGDDPGQGRAREPEPGTGGPHRHLKDMLALLNPEVLSPRARDRAERVLSILAEAEAVVHATPVEKVHFHEISGIDTAVDVIGSCIALDLLDADSVSASAPGTGSGMIMCAHGLLPVPAPATLEILKSRNIPWRSGGDGERLTPTGAALLAGVAETFGGAPELNVMRIGYGGGKNDFADAPNLVRVIVGKPTAGGGSLDAGTEGGDAGTAGMPLAVNAALPPAERKPPLPDLADAHRELVVEFRAVIDDMTPEAVAFLQEACLAAGAVEAYSLPATMKKGRLGHEITVIAHAGRAGKVLDVMWRQSSTFGIRLREISRIVLAREIRAVEVDGRRIRVKLGMLGDEIIRRQPEYEDCRAAALATGKSLREIFGLADAAARR